MTQESIFEDVKDSLALTMRVLWRDLGVETSEDQAEQGSRCDLLST